MAKRKLWSDKSMADAVSIFYIWHVNDGRGLREASRLYNVPIETLRWRETGTVDLSCKPGPSTVLTPERAVFGWLCSWNGRSEDLMRLAYVIVSRSGRPHPFHNGMAGRGWMERFRSIIQFFTKLGALYGHLNLIAKRMHVFNIVETGISIVHKPGKVIFDLGRKCVFAYQCRKGMNTYCCILCVCKWSCTATIYYLP